MGSSNMAQVRTTTLDDHFNYCVVVLKGVKGGSAILDRQTRRNIIDVPKHVVGFAAKGQQFLNEQLSRLGRAPLNRFKDINNQGP